MKVIVVVYDWHGLIAENEPEIYLRVDDPVMWENISKFLETDIKNMDDLVKWKEDNEASEVDEYVYLFDVELPSEIRR